MSERQSAAAVLMVRPANFGFNEQTAASNEFQRRPANNAGAAPQPAALREFDALAEQLLAAGVQVIIGADTPLPVKPDAVFPNNWLSFHADGSVVLYPMLAPNRRLERREELVELVRRQGGFRVTRTVDLSAQEVRGRFLEGTGSMVLDRPQRVAYASLSPRTDLAVLGEFAQLLDYRIVSFESCGANGQPVYHTNVVMAVGSGFAVVCAQAITSAAQRAAVLTSLRSAGREVIEISLAQMQHFAGNLLELQGTRGPLIVLSTTAWESLTPGQRTQLQSFGAILPAHVSTIEHLGGGSVRCMLAEIHLPRIEVA